MNQSEVYRNLRFERRPSTSLRRLLTVLLFIVIFTLLWKYVPHTTLYWILIPILGILGWLSTYSWRQALSSAITFLHRIERL